MPWIDVHNVGNVGIVRDIGPHELPPEAWSDGRNVRFTDARVEQIMGYTQFDTSVCAAPTYCISVPRQDTTADIWVYTSESEVYAFTGSANAKITASSISATGQNTWTGTLLSGVLVLNYQQGKPLGWVFPPATGTPLAVLTDWSASWTCKVIRSFKNYLVALHMTESSTDYPFRVRWSTAADPGVLPTSWNAADPAQDAGFYDLIEGGDWLVDGAPLGDKFIVYKQNSVWSLSYIGGTYVFQFEKIYAGWGALSRHSIAVIGQRHFVVGPNDIYIHDGYSEPQPLLEGRLKKWFYSTIARDATDKLHVVANHPQKEVWVFIPTSSSGTCTRAMIYNYADNTWSFRNTPNIVATGVGGLDYSVTTNTWNAQTGTWDNTLGTWNEDVYFRENRVVMCGEDDGKMYLADIGWTDNGALFTSYVERKCISLDGQSRDGNPRAASTGMKTCRGVWPKITCRKNTTISIYVGSQNDPLDAVTWSGPFRYDPFTMKKIDCRVTGRYLAIKFECGEDMGWKLHSYTLDVITAGRF